MSDPVLQLDRELLTFQVFKDFPAARRKHSVLWIQHGLTVQDFRRYCARVVSRNPRSPARVIGAAFKDFEAMVDDAKRLRNEPEPNPRNPSFFEQQLQAMEPEQRKEFRRQSALAHIRAKVQDEDWTLEGAIREANKVYQVSPEVTTDEANEFLAARPGRKQPSEHARSVVEAMRRKARAKFEQEKEDGRTDRHA